MSKLFNVFIRPPYSQWALEYNYGELLHPEAGRSTDHVRLVTDSDDAFLFATCSGELSALPQAGSIAGLAEISDDPELSLPETTDLWLVMCPLANLVSDLLTGLAQFTGVNEPGSAQIAFTYYNVEVASFMEDVRELLRLSTVPPADPNADDEEIRRRMRLFLQGQLTIFVDSGQRLGRAGVWLDPAPTATRAIGFGLTTSLLGPGNPPQFIDNMRSMFEEEADIPDLLVLIPNSPNAFSSAASKDDAIQMTATAIYPSSDLEGLRTDWSLSRSEWRLVGNNQKAQYRRRLLARYGLLPGSTNVPIFEFSQTDPDNIFQLEAVVEFFANFTDPWVPNSVPIDVSPTDHSDIDRSTLVIEGTNATFVGSQIRLHDSPDLDKVRKFHHFIYFLNGNRVHFYRITSIDNTQKRVTAVDCNGSGPPQSALGPWRIDLFTEVDFLPLSGATAQIQGSEVTVDVTSELKQIKTLSSLPEGAGACVNDGIVFAADPNRMYLIDRVDPEHSLLHLATPVQGGITASAWEISHVPILVLIDPIGPRLKGPDAIVVSPGVVQLNSANLQKVNVGGAETIFLGNDSARPSRTYRISSKDESAKTVTLDGNPAFENGNSAWQIPAGVGGIFEPLGYNLGPREARWPSKTGPFRPAGFDHYDGIMFVVDNGKVTAKHRWSSFTSRTQFDGNRRSIRGNHRYEVFSFTSTESDFRNYCFRVNDQISSDNVFPQARNYFDEGVREAGQRRIRIHLGTLTAENGGTGSAGCNVSPEFYKCRKDLIEIYQGRRAATLGTPGTREAGMDLLLKTDHKTNAQLQKNSFGASGAERKPPILLQAGWEKKIFCFYWLIRPDERPAPP